MILFVFALFLGFFQNAAHRSGRIDPVSRAVQALVVPSATGVAGVFQNIADFGQGIKQAPELKREAEELRGKVSSLENELIQADMERTELRELKELLDLPTAAGRSSVVARIVGIDPYRGRITLSSGSAQGVKPRLPVIGPEGLVAIVEAVDENRSQAVLITSPEVKLGARALREDGPVDGIITGNTPNTLEFEVVRNAPIEVGDKIVTSGLSEVIPGGLMIGEVIEVTPAPEIGSRLIKVFPKLSPSFSQEVIILK